MGATSRRSIPPICLMLAQEELHEKLGINALALVIDTLLTNEPTIDRVHCPLVFVNRYYYGRICSVQDGKGSKNGKVYNWETVKYGMINWCLDDVDIDILIFFEPKFPAIIYNDALKVEPNFLSKPKLNCNGNLDNMTSSPEFNYKIYKSKVERKSLKKWFSKKEKFNILNIDKDLFSYEIPSANNLQLDKGNDDDKIGVELFSIDSLNKPMGDTIDISFNTYVSDEAYLYFNLNFIDSFIPNLETSKGRMEKVTGNEHEGKSETFMNDFDWFNCDTPLEKGFDEFCQRWWGKKGMKDELSDGGWSSYVPTDEWKLLELEKNNPNQINQDCMGEYGLMVDDNKFDFMCDYLLSKDALVFMSDKNKRVKEKKCKLIGMPRERIAMIEQEFNDWARTKRYIEDPK
ncbi:hypothetical protein Tco_1265255 [Tanacetum coccineum]